MSLAILINPSERELLENAGDRPPLGLLYLGKWLKKNGQDVKVFDMNHDSYWDISKSVINDNPKLVGISCYTSPMLNESMNLSKWLRSITRLKIVMGGYHASVMPKSLIDCANHVTVGEGEYALQYLMDGNADGFIVKGWETNLDSLGSPDRDLLDMSKYNMQINGLRTATLMTSRGCPMNCSFCGNMNKTTRFHDIHDIIKEIQELKRKKYEAIYLVDDVFTLRKERAKLISEVLKSEGMKFRATTRANFINEDIVETFAKNGCITLSMGIESGNEEILKKCNKKQTLEQITNAIKICGKHKVPVKGFFIIGLPGETEQTAKETIN